MKKFISVLLSCSLICGNALGAETKSKETPSQTNTYSTAKESKNKKLKYGLISGGIICAAGITSVLGRALIHQKNSTPTATLVDDHHVPEEAISLVNEHRVPGPVARRYKEELLTLPSHCVLNGKEFREYLSKFPDAPILFRGVYFDSPDKMDTYMSDFVRDGLAISSTCDANGLNVCGTEKPDGRAVYFSKDINTSLGYTTGFNLCDGTGHLILASFTKSTKSKIVCPAMPRENGDFILCTESISITDRRKFARWYFDPNKCFKSNIIADYDFTVPELGDEDYEGLSGIRDIQIWLLRLGIVLQEVDGNFEGKFDPDRADELLKKLEPTEQLAS